MQDSLALLLFPWPRSGPHFFNSRMATDSCIQYLIFLNIHPTFYINQWRIFRVFKVFSEHLKMKKKIQKIGFRAFISD